MSAKDDREPFLSRWSRLKQEARDEPAESAPAKQDETHQPVPELPPVDQLNYDSDFKAFMDKRVDERLRRIALKKLFSDPRFNVTDGLDDYAEDYSALEDLTTEMVERQLHARRILRGPEPEEKPATEKPATAQPEERSAEVAATSDAQPEPANRRQRPDSEEEASGKPGEKDKRHG
jgi:hypothetical protein